MAILNVRDPVIEAQINQKLSKEIQYKFFFYFIVYFRKNQDNNEKYKNLLKNFV